MRNVVQQGISKGVSLRIGGALMIFLRHLLVSTVCSFALSGAADQLESGFDHPPEQTKPWCYWYWMRDNVSREGISRDLESMARVGIGEAMAATIFITNVPAGDVKVLTPQWWDLVEHTIREGGRTGVNIGLFNCPGWSQSGGPWIKPDQAMRYLVSSELRVTGPTKLSEKLPMPKKPFQDVAVLAFPSPQEDADALQAHSPRVTCVPPVADAQKLADGDLGTSIVFPEGAGRGSEPFRIEIQTGKPLTTRSLEIYPAEDAFSADCVLEAVGAAGQWRIVRRFRFDRSNMNPGVGPMPRGPVCVSFSATTANRFRLLFSGITFGRLYGSTLSVHAALAEINLTGAARLEAVVEKQLGKMHPTPTPTWDAYLWPTPAEPDSTNLTVPPGAVRDLSARLKPDGTLNWDVPPGSWVILRTGMTPTGKKNEPAPPEGQGLEVDKMSRSCARYHFDSFIGQLLQRLPASERKAFTHVVADSYETGSENWTDEFGAAFQKRYGYDPKPWLPVLTGRIVASADQSERFLWDLRRLVADRIATDYVGGLRVACRSHGLKLWLENYGHWGFPSEFLKYGSESDCIGGEFWMDHGDRGAIECRAASSCGNTYGKTIVSAEAFTGGLPFQHTPSTLKERGDWAMCEGINHFVLHVYMHQPWEDKAPGMNGPWGTEFNRHNTWFEESKAWIGYLRRSCWLLQQGHRVTDVAYFIGEDAPKMTGLKQPALPPGRDYDFINAEVIEKSLRARGGELALPHGTTYRVLVLPEQSTMRPELLRRIRDLVQSGATVLGRPPSKSPSLEGFPACDAVVKKLAAELWGTECGNGPGEHRFGKGRVIWGESLEQVLKALGSEPDFQSAANLRFTHRRSADADIYFLANPKAEDVFTIASFRVEDKAPELWWPDSGRREQPALYGATKAIVRLPLALAPNASVFVVFRNAALPVAQRVVSVSYDGTTLLDLKNHPPNASEYDRQPAAITTFPSITVNSAGRVNLRACRGGDYQVESADGRKHSLKVPSLTSAVELTGPWELSFARGLGAPAKIIFDRLTDWTSRPEDGIRYFSGKAIYRKTFHLDGALESGSNLSIDLGEVHSLATVRVNGKELGTLWLPPWRLDISAAVKTGDNTLEIEIVNTWRNRLVHDAALPEKERLTFIADPTVRPELPLLPAGLLGPVRLLTSKTIELY